MCGICGFLGGRMLSDEMNMTVRRMAETIRHRGPDDGGAWVNPRNRVALGQRRLSIIDISPAGHQPMTSHSGRYTVVFNGEIYNHPELRDRLERRAGSIRWRGYSDTEVLLTGFDVWGVVPTLTELNGMFAFAVWDSSELVLYMARDRMGEKPLYYSWQQGVLIFGSELRALRTYPKFAAAIDRKALKAFFQLNCIPAPQTVYENVWKLPPASYLRASVGQTGAEAVTYWSARQVAINGMRNRRELTDEEAVDRLDGLLRDAVRMRMISDVPLGSFLSGGIDSSIVTALMQAQSPQRIRTFSMGISERGFDEAPQALAVARHIGTDHTEMYISDQDAKDVIPLLPQIYDEPFSDSSQIPTYLLARLTRQHVTVALSGDGGDELFGGYNRHLWTDRMWKSMRCIPLPLRHALAKAVTSLSTDTWDDLFRQYERWLPSAMRHRIPGYKLHKMAAIATANSPATIYGRLTAHWKTEDGLVREDGGISAHSATRSGWSDTMNVAEEMMFLDSVTYLPDDILVKVDRASMATALEGRIPLLDHRIYEFSWSLPLRFKLRDGKSKWILRQLLARYVPAALTERPKSGFGVPLAAWLRGSLREWGEDLLSEKRLKADGYLNPGPVRRKWTEHLSGRGHWEYHLWDVLMFQAWLESQQLSLALGNSTMFGQSGV